MPGFRLCNEIQSVLNWVADTGTRSIRPDRADRLFARIRMVREPFPFFQII